jgi:hypothetical protein
MVHAPAEPGSRSAMSDDDRGTLGEDAGRAMTREGLDRRR